MKRIMKRAILLGVAICTMFLNAMAENESKEEALKILQNNVPYCHTVSTKTMEAWEAGDENAIAFMDMTEETKKAGINKMDAAVQMFQKLYFPGDPFYRETLEGRYMQERFMAEGKLIPHIYHVMPAPDEIERNEAGERALDAMKTKYNLFFAGLTRNMRMDTHYFTPTGNLKDAFWLFHVTLENGDKYAIQVKSGEVTVCQRLEQEEKLFSMYDDLCSEKGAFFQWSLEEKAEYAKQLPDMIMNAYIEGQDLRRCADLIAIARQGFCMPDEKNIDQNSALENAVMAAADRFYLQDGWAEQAEIAYSYFQQENKAVWRVIFWKTGQTELPGVVVDMDAQTGAPFRVERYDATPESIPYAERL